jgi:SAM-dependent methyltransferase
MTTLDLPQENVFGHTKKLELLLQAIEEHRRYWDLKALRILDYGCGNGNAVTQFLCQSGHYVTAVDLHSESIEYARRHFGSSTCDFIVGDWSALPEGKERFDIVVFGDVLEHVDRPDPLLRSARDLLKPGGYVLVSVPNGFGPFEIESYVSRLPVFGFLSIKAVSVVVGVLNRFVFPRAWSRLLPSEPIPYNEESGHVQFFRWRALCELCQGCGFEVEASRNLSFLCGPYTNSLFAPWTAFCKANAAVADRLPTWMVSAWFLELRKAED